MPVPVPQVLDHVAAVKIPPAGVLGICDVACKVDDCGDARAGGYEAREDRRMFPHSGVFSGRGLSAHSSRVVQRIVRITVCPSDVIDAATQTLSPTHIHES